MLGRFLAGFACIVLFFLIPLKYEAKREAVRCEKYIYEALNETYVAVKTNGRLTLRDMEELSEKISLMGTAHDVEIEIGTFLYGREETVVLTTYTGEIMERLKNGEELMVRGKLLTISAKPLKESTEVKLSNMLWDTFVPRSVQSVGGLIHG